jgi:hypothetical protein
MYAYFLLTDTGLDFLIDAPSKEDAIEAVESIIKHSDQKHTIVCCRPAQESYGYFEQVQ